MSRRCRSSNAPRRSRNDSGVRGAPDSGGPAALPEHQPQFRALSHNPFLIATGIAFNPGALTPGELRDAAWPAIEPHFERRLSALVDAYGEARGHGRGSGRLEEVAAAVAQNRVGTLLVEADRQVQGSIDAAQGAVAYATDPQNAAPGSDPGSLMSWTTWPRRPCAPAGK